MPFLRRIKRFGVLLALLSMLGLQLTPAHAALVGNADLLQQARQQVTKETLTSFIERSDVRRQLVTLGVDPEAARDRVHRMTDAEIARLVGEMDQVPAGGESVIGILLLLFIIFIITDMLGATDIFPFVKNINK